MTSYLISALQTTTENLSTTADDLLVTSSGSIIVTTSNTTTPSDDDGVYATASNQAITIDGLVYSTNADANCGVEITAEFTVLDVNGQVQGDAGVIVDDGGGFDRISVGSQGTIDGTRLSVGFLGNIGDPSVTDNFLGNAGDISGEVFAQSGGGDEIDNSGQMSGPIAVYFSNNVATETLENSGTITGGGSQGSIGSAIFTTISSAGIDIVNSGLLTDDGTNAINTGGAVLYFDDNGGTTSTIDNTGSISGSGYVIQSLADILDISNSGTVSGGLDSTAAVDITTNSGLWEASSGSATVFTLSAADDRITNSKTGAIDGGISIVSGGDTITNAGGIDGPIAFTGTGGTNGLTNSGEITGAVALSGGSNTVDNSGLIDGEVSMAHSHDTVNNAGAIDGLVSIAAGSDTFTNAGTIDGQVMFWSTGTGNSMTNSGSITGDVTLPGSSSAANHGQIYGDVILGASDTLINTGTIHGNVTLGSIDTFDVSPGIVTGAINASTNDVFEFGGDFGKVTFDDFVAGSGPTHDTIQFAANDFSTFSQVQAASTQQGPDVVIKLDATDSITLNNVTLASLVSADFTFV